MSLCTSVSETAAGGMRPGQPSEDMVSMRRTSGTCCGRTRPAGPVSPFDSSAGGLRHGRRTPASSSGNCGGQPYVLSSWLSLSAHALMGMPVQWKPCGKSTRLPHSRWYADANSSCAPAGSATVGRRSGERCSAGAGCAAAHLGQREGVAEVQQAVHVWVREVAKELAAALHPCGTATLCHSLPSAGLPACSLPLSHCSVGMPSAGASTSNILSSAQRCCMLACMDSSRSLRAKFCGPCDTN